MPLDACALADVSQCSLVMDSESFRDPDVNRYDMISKVIDRLSYHPSSSSIVMFVIIEEATVEQTEKRTKAWENSSTWNSKLKYIGEYKGPGGFQR